MDGRGAEEKVLSGLADAAAHQVTALASVAARSVDLLSLLPGEAWSKPSVSDPPPQAAHIQEVG